MDCVWPMQMLYLGAVDVDEAGEHVWRSVMTLNRMLQSGRYLDQIIHGDTRKSRLSVLTIYGLNFS